MPAFWVSLLLTHFLVLRVRDCPSVPEAAGALLHYPAAACPGASYPRIFDMLMLCAVSRLGAMQTMLNSISRRPRQTTLWKHRGNGVDKMPEAVCTTTSPR